MNTQVKVPDYQTLMVYVLNTLKTNGTTKRSEIKEIIAKELNITAEQRAIKVASGTYMYDGNVNWAITYLGKAGLIQSTQRGIWKITERGLEILSKNPTRVDNGHLSQFEEFKKFQTVSKIENNSKDKKDNHSSTPDQLLRDAYNQTKGKTISDIMDYLAKCEPATFETLVLKVVQAAGYGWNETDSGFVTGKSGDQGIDGVIFEDRFGLDKVYLQAKRWNEHNVGSADIRNFMGSLSIKGATKGIIITNSNFSKDAINEANASHIYKIKLIDGEELAKLMWELNIGVFIKESFHIKEFDADLLDLED